MDGHDGRGAWSDGFFNFAGIDIEGAGIDVHKYGPGADMGDGPGAGYESKGSGDDFVAGANVESEKRENERVGAGCAGYGVSAVGEGADFFFEGVDFRTENKLLAFQIFVDGLEYFFADGGELCFEIEKWERFGHR